MTLSDSGKLVFKDDMWILGMVWETNWKSYIQKVQMASIACDDVSTHGKFISYIKESNQQTLRLSVQLSSFDGFSKIYTRQTGNPTYDAPITSSVALIRWSLGDNKKKELRFPITSRWTVWLCFFDGETNLLRDSWTNSECSDLRVEPKNLLLRVRMLKQWHMHDGRNDVSNTPKNK